jgi:diguanylate cyclase (GGDEF)-like protein
VSRGGIAGVPQPGRSPRGGERPGASGRHGRRALPVASAAGAVLPAIALALLARIERAQRRRLQLLAHQRSRLQTAVRRLGEALAARLDLQALTSIVLRGAVEALDAETGMLTLDELPGELTLQTVGDPRGVRALRAVAESAHDHGRACELQREGIWAIALPFGFDSDAGVAHGAVAVARHDRPFREDERELLDGLVECARQGAVDIVTHRLLRRQAQTDALTGLGNRRKLLADIDQRMAAASGAQPLALLLVDLDGFKPYNDAFGHQAGDAILVRLARRLEAAIGRHGSAYRLGGDEFCALLTLPREQLPAIRETAIAALHERGDGYAVSASYGAALIPDEARDLERALRLADERMYARKRERHAGAALLG